MKYLNQIFILRSEFFTLCGPMRSDYLCRSHSHCGISLSVQKSQSLWHFISKQLQNFQILCTVSTVSDHG